MRTDLVPLTLQSSLAQLPPAISHLIILFFIEIPTIILKINYMLFILLNDLHRSYIKMDGVSNIYCLGFSIQQTFCGFHSCRVLVQGGQFKHSNIQIKFLVLKGCLYYCLISFIFNYESNIWVLGVCQTNCTELFTYIVFISSS